VIPEATGIGTAVVIDFEPGSGWYESGSGLYRFRASDDLGQIRCAISLDALCDLLRTGIDTFDPMAVFQRNERVVFNLAREMYQRRGRDEAGALTLSVFDVANARRRH